MTNRSDSFFRQWVQKCRSFCSTIKRITFVSFLIHTLRVLTLRCYKEAVSASACSDAWLDHSSDDREPSVCLCAAGAELRRLRGLSSTHCLEASLCLSHTLHAALFIRKCLSVGTSNPNWRSYAIARRRAKDRPATAVDVLTRSEYSQQTPEN